MDFLLLVDGDTQYRLSAFGTLDGWIGVGLVKMAGAGSYLLPQDVVEPFLMHCQRMPTALASFVEVFENI